MALEVERKYIFETQEEVDRLIAERIHVSAIVQWYLDKGERLSSSQRLRWSLFPDSTKPRAQWSERWVYSSKTSLDDDFFRRQENETAVFPENPPGFLQPFLEDPDTLFRFPFVSKLRFLLREEPEVVLDIFWMPFVSSRSSRGEEGTLVPMMEIELKRNRDETVFPEVLRQMGLQRAVRDVTGEARFLNHQLALACFPQISTKPSFSWLSRELASQLLKYQ
ncbi:MAG TPA: hypothetical protein P5560_06780 [Thermotogota bacterium]|nr:hypothetical protein [Thermotogota bacterium]